MSNHELEETVVRIDHALQQLAKSLHDHGVDLYTGTRIVDQVRVALTPPKPFARDVVDKWIKRLSTARELHSAWAELQKQLNDAETLKQAHDKLYNELESVAAALAATLPTPEYDRMSLCQKAQHLRIRAERETNSTVDKVLRVVDRHVRYWIPVKQVALFLHAVRRELSEEGYLVETSNETVDTSSGAESSPDEAVQTRIANAPMPNTLYRDHEVVDGHARPRWFAEVRIASPNDIFVVRGAGPTPLDALRDYEDHWQRVQQQIAAQVEGP